MNVSFVIVNYNRKNELLETIGKTKELIKDNLDYEIVIVDNASSDGSAEAVKVNHPDVVLIENKINTGAPAWNEGFDKAKGDYFIIIDDDSHIECGLEEAINYMESNKDIGVLALNVVSGPYTSKGWKWKNGQDLVGFIGCGAVFRKSVYDEIGGYADWIFLYANEWELGLRVLEAGYRVEYFEKCEVVHRASAINRSSKRLRVFVTSHEMAIVYKYLSSRWTYLFRMMLNNIKGLRQMGFKVTWYNIIGTIKFLRMRRTLIYTPVSHKSQQLFLNHFESTLPAFEFIKRPCRTLIKKFGLQPVARFNQ
ncbi:MAG: glycosyltransferase family 2 protein [Janthinobacterium lividum]